MINVSEDFNKVKTDLIWLYYLQFRNEIEKLVEPFNDDELCTLAGFLNVGWYDEATLGEYRGAEFTLTLYAYLQKRIGIYNIIKFMHLVYHRGEYGYCRTEAEFNAYWRTAKYKYDVPNPIDWADLHPHLKLKALFESNGYKPDNLN